MFCNHSISSRRRCARWRTAHIPSALHLSLAALTVLSVIGCGERTLPPIKVPNEQTAQAVLFDLLDSSQSDRPALPTHVEERGNLALAVGSSTTWLTTIRFDSEAQELFSGPMPETDEELLARIAPAISPISTRDNTYLNLPLTCVADRAARCAGRCVVLVSTDGFDEGMTNAMHDELNRAAQNLADNPHVVAVFVEGVNSANMAQMRLDLAPLSKKLQFVSDGTLDVNLIAELLRSGGVRS